MTDPYYTEDGKTSHWQHQVELTLMNDSDVHNAIREIVRLCTPYRTTVPYGIALEPWETPEYEKMEALIQAGDAIKALVEEAVYDHLDVITQNTHQTGMPEAAQYIIQSFVELGIASVNWADVADRWWVSLREEGIEPAVPCLFCGEPTTNQSLSVVTRDHICDECIDVYDGDEIMDAARLYAPYADEPKPRFFRHQHRA